MGFPRENLSYRTHSPASAAAQTQRNSELLAEAEFGADSEEKQEHKSYS